MKTFAIILSFAAVVPRLVHADLTLAQGGQAEVVIVRQPGATAAEQHAVNELADTLKQITGGEFTVQEAGATVPEHAIVVGPGSAAKALFPDVPFDQLGQEEIVIRTQGGRLLLAGGRPRGTLYAVSQFLQDQGGVRWWTPWASRLPKHSTLTIGALDVRYAPVFESRDPYWFPAFNSVWAVRNFSNSQSAGIPESQGGCIRYKGFVHTAYPLVPPAEHFAQHPEWFALVNGKRLTNDAQLCLMNPELREFVVGRVKQWLRESPDAQIVSVSQNDCFNPCACPQCKAVDDAEGSHAGTLLDFVNYVAEKIEPEFPQVAVDTLAYQYTRKPPKTMRPRPNVIVRLCSIECNFREPLDAPANATFAADIRGWAQICQRLYIWDYTTDFGHYDQPHPNWFVLGPNLRFFAANHVRGVFEQGAYQSYGSEFTELRAWVLAQLLWNPAKDDRALINEFLDGYYGAAAGPIRRYLELMHGASAGWNLTCFSPTKTRFHDLKTLTAAEQLWDEAEKAVAADEELVARVRMGRLPVRYVWLSLWDSLRRESTDAGAAWPLPASRKAVADECLKLAQGVPGKDWTQVRQINESGLTPAKFVERFAKDTP